MKKILLVILFLLLFPSMVLAKDTCNNNDITIEEINVEEKEDYTEELTPVSIENNKINLNLEMYNVGESITYKIKVKNNSNNDYYFTKDSFNLNTDYLEYSLLNNSEVIKSNEEKEIELKITYKKQISEDEFNENNMMSITLSDTPLNNPSTKRTISLILLVIFITIIVITINRNKKLNKVLIGILICSIPLSIKALCTVNLEINTNITINEKEAVFLPGPEVNAKMKELAGDNTSTEIYAPNFSDENITLIKCSKQEPIDSNKEEKNLVSIIDSPYPIYMWYEENTIYWWSEAHHPKLNQDASYMFNNMLNLTKIESLDHINSSLTENISFMFRGDSSILDINGVEKWDTSNITNLRQTFAKISITSLEPLKDWDVSSAENIMEIFRETKFTNLHGLENWDVSNVTDMQLMFSSNENLTSIDALSNWNTSEVTNMSSAFSGTANLTTLEPLRNWDTSNVTNMRNTFMHNQKLKSIEALENWNTSNVTRMDQMFLGADLIDLHGLENWDVSKVRSFGSMFMLNENLTDASAINDWDIQPTAYYFQMFRGAPTHPEFSKVPGTWSNGDFIPS